MQIKLDITHTVIQTERTILRGWHTDDFSDLYEYASPDGVGELAGWKHHSSIEESKRVLQMFMDEQEVFALVYKPSNKVIGTIGLYDSWLNEIDEYKDLNAKELGYALSKEFWGLGLMTEAVKATLDYCFNSLKLDAVTCSHFHYNHKSKHVIEKSGFKYYDEGIFISKPLQQSFEVSRYILFNNQKTDQE